MPKKVKHRKQHRGNMNGRAKRGENLAFGDFGLKASEPSWVTSAQIEAARKAIVRYLKKGGKMWIRIFPDKPYTKKPLEVRMGGGKAEPVSWVAVVKTGRVMFEVVGISREDAMKALRVASHKLPLATEVVVRQEVEEVKNETSRA